MVNATDQIAENRDNYLPVSEKSGWPWTFGYSDGDASRSDFEWPLISVITPSYNQAEFLEETIRSVLLQNYPKLEYIVIDGGSEDGSVEIIRKYDPWLGYWVSEKDLGQSQAINKGFRHAKGEILAWLNSDDYYEPNAIRTAVLNLLSRNASIIYGNCNLVTEQGDFLEVIKPARFTFRSLLRYWRPSFIPPQPAIIFRRDLYLHFGPLDENLHYAMDHDFWLKITSNFEPCYVDSILANYRIHDRSKSGKGWETFMPEWSLVSKRNSFLTGLSTGIGWWIEYAIYIIFRSLFRKFENLINQSSVEN